MKVAKKEKYLIPIFIFHWIKMNTFLYIFIHFYYFLVKFLFLYQLSGKQNSCYALLPPLWQVTVFDTFVTKRMCHTDRNLLHWIYETFSLKKFHWFNAKFHWYNETSLIQCRNFIKFYETLWTASLKSFIKVS